MDYDTRVSYQAHFLAGRLDVGCGGGCTCWMLCKGREWRGVRLMRLRYVVTV